MEASLTRKIAESPIYIGKNETIPYTVDFAGFVPTAVTALTTPVVTLHDITRVTDPERDNGVDVSSTKLSGSPTFANLVLTLPMITGLAAGNRYMLRCKGTGGGGVYELWAVVRGEH